MITACPALARLLWLYRRTAEFTWSVGYFDPDGDWHQDSTHSTPGCAARRVHWLNGDNSDLPAADRLALAEVEITRLEQLLTRLDTVARKWEGLARRKARHTRELQRRGFRR